MSEKKHKGGYELLKEKYAKLEAKLAKTEAALYNVSSELSQEKERINELKKERDELKAKYEQKCASAKLFENETTRLHGIIEEADERIAFLLDHCPFWVRWLYRKLFEKGGEK